MRDRPGLVPAETLAGLDRDALAAALRPLWEDAGPLVDRLIGRPFRSWDEMVEAAAGEIAVMGAGERAELLRAHPRIGTPTEMLAARSAASLYEQQAGGEAGDDVLARLAELNDRYEARFGFPFVAWVAGRSRQAMIPVLRERLAGDRCQELAAGCAALVAIARDRLRALHTRHP